MSGDSRGSGRRAPDASASTTSGGACTSSISTPSPPIGNSSLPLGWTKQMSRPARAACGCRRARSGRRWAVEPGDRRGQVVDPQADVIERRARARPASFRIERLHEVDLDPRAPLPSAQMSSSTFSRSLRKCPSTARPRHVDPEPRAAAPCRGRRWRSAGCPRTVKRRSVSWLALDPAFHPRRPAAHRIQDDAGRPPGSRPCWRRSARRRRRARRRARFPSSSPRSRRAARPPAPPGPAAPRRRRAGPASARAGSATGRAAP